MHQLLNRLENTYVNHPDKFFTMCLNTDPSDPDQQGGKWKIHLKNGLEDFEQYIKKSQDQEE